MVFRLKKELNLENTPKFKILGEKRYIFYIIRQIFNNIVQNRRK